MRYPDRQRAHEILEEAHALNPGPWRDHSVVTAQCAEKIALACGMDSEKAYVLGLLHDIGRRFGVTGMRHACDGHDYMMRQGYVDVARVCLTHSFPIMGLENMLGKNDLTKDEAEFMDIALRALVFNDYDKLIILCDSISMAEGYADQIVRMNNVKQRYGWYPQEKWDANIALREYFEQKAGKTLAEIMETATERAKIMI